MDHIEAELRLQALSYALGLSKETLDCKSMSKEEIRVRIHILEKRLQALINHNEKDK